VPPLDKDKIADLADRARVELRKRMRALRSAHPERALATRSALIVERIAEHPTFTNARSLALFYPLLERKEVDLRELDARARVLNKRIYYPFMDATPTGFRTGLALTNSLEDLAERGRRFLEPSPSALRAERGDVDLVIVPALAAAPNGHRLGYGAGFYDATLPDFRPPARALVVIFDFQLLVELPSLSHDVACDAVVTDRRTLAVSDPQASS
jgi:5-formyltetrahydrofolate cyclo-ligase